MCVCVRVRCVCVCVLCVCVCVKRRKEGESRSDKQTSKVWGERRRMTEKKREREEKEEKRRERERRFLFSVVLTSTHALNTLKHSNNRTQYAQTNSNTTHKTTLKFKTSSSLPSFNGYMFLCVIHSMRMEKELHTVKGIGKKGETNNKKKEKNYTE